MWRYLGVDLHKNVFTVCFLEPETGKDWINTYRLSKITCFKKDLRKTDKNQVKQNWQHQKNC